jgi:diguanylate cyclase (GGDEF)-like protein
MAASAVDRVLACRTLPSLPAIALQVIELTRDANVPIDRIAKLVQNDPALATRILRTVNSSYYGLTSPCPTISRAVSLLGINTVKSLVLGFSLVDMTGSSAKKGFDLTSYWRRTIYSAAGARLLAKRARCCDIEEAFIGGLLQDVGMLAAHSALGDAYTEILASAPEDHDALGGTEFAAAGFDHASVGAALMERWKLPPQVVECTRRHHEPDLAKPAFASLVRLVALGADAAAAMTLSQPNPRLARFRARAKDWFDLGGDELDALVHEIAEGAAQVSSLFQTPTGARPDVTMILSQANELLALHQLEVEKESSTIQAQNRELERLATTDALTGVFNRQQFDARIAAIFAMPRSRPVSLLFTDADRFKAINDTHGHQAGDAVLIAIADRFKRAIGERGVVCRYGGEEFAVILPGATAAEAESAGEQLRRAVEATPVDLSALGVGVRAVPVTVCVGVASTHGGGITQASQLVRAADEAVYRAKREGRNRVCCASGNTMDAGAEGKLSILAIEDDALAAKLIELLFGRRNDTSVRTVASAEEAAQLLSSGYHVDVLLCDAGLPDQQEPKLIARLRKESGWGGRPILGLTSGGDGKAGSALLAAGATRVASKQEFCSDFAKWTQAVADMATRVRRAA